MHMHSICFLLSIPFTLSYYITIGNSAASIGRIAWNSITTPESSPFCHFPWISALETSDCASPSTGWQPLHIAIYENDNDSAMLLALMLCYVKSHSRGEFIFDQSWAEFAELQLGIRYYPKASYSLFLYIPEDFSSMYPQLLSAVPFTPATGERILYHPSLTIDQKQEISTLCSQTFLQLTSQNRLSSCHVNFVRPTEIEPFIKQNYLLRQTVQYRYNALN